MVRFNAMVGLLRVVACYAVVSCHFGAKVPLSDYAVPAFMILAFYFWKVRTRSELVNRLRRIAVPYVAWGLIGVLSRCVIERRINAEWIVNQILFGMSGNSPLYFLQLVMIGTIIVFYVQQLFPERKFFVLGVVSGCCLVLQYSGMNNLMWRVFSPYGEVTMGRMIECFPFMVIGYFLASHLQSVWVKVKMSRVTESVLAVCVLGAIFCGRMDVHGYGYAGVLRMIGATAFTFLAIVSGEVLNRMDADYIGGILWGFSALTPGIYYSHKIIGSLIVFALPLSVREEIWLTLLVFVLSAIAAWCCHKINFLEPYVR